MLQKEPEAWAQLENQDPSVLGPLLLLFSLSTLLFRTSTREAGSEELSWGG